MSTSRRDRRTSRARAAPDPRDEDTPDVAISASVRADALRANVPAQTHIEFAGKGSVVTRRVGVPPTGAVLGVTHRDVTIATDIEARAPDTPPTAPPRRKAHETAEPPGPDEPVP